MLTYIDVHVNPIRKSNTSSAHYCFKLTHGFIGCLNINARVSQTQFKLGLRGTSSSLAIGTLIEEEGISLEAIHISGRSIANLSNLAFHCLERILCKFTNACFHTCAYASRSILLCAQNVS